MRARERARVRPRVKVRLGLGLTLGWDLCPLIPRPPAPLLTGLVLNILLVMSIMMQVN